MRKGSHHYTVYLNEIMHRWLVVLYFVGASVMPLYSVVDYYKFNYASFEDYFFQRTAISLLLYLTGFFIHFSAPTRYSFLYGYFFSLIISLQIIYIMIMNNGFDSTYYGGLNLAILSVNLFLPLRLHHTVINGLMVIILYLGLNLLFPKNYEFNNLINNFSFILVTFVSTVVIKYFHNSRMESEFRSRQDLRHAKDALWGEMELAKKIQVSLIPEKKQINGYEISSRMLPAADIGGDYYDIIENHNGAAWVAFGDVCGHGVESGLFMMMAQTSIATAVKSGFYDSPAEVLVNLNDVIFENINRLHVERYMTMILLKLKDNRVTFSGRHMDLLVYRKRTATLEVISEPGIYIGIVEKIRDSLEDRDFIMESGDILLLFTDGITEAFDHSNNMYGQSRLELFFLANCGKPVETIRDLIVADVIKFQKHQTDDISLMLLKKI